MPVILNGKNLVGGELNGKKLKYVYNGDKLIWQAVPPVVFDSVGAYSGVSGNATSWSHTVVAPGLLVAFVSHALLSGTVSGVVATVNGSPMTEVGFYAPASNQRVSVFAALVTPGAKTVATSRDAGGTGSVSGNSIAFSGATLTGAPVFDYGSGRTTASLSVAPSTSGAYATYVVHQNALTTYPHTTRWSNATTRIGDGPGNVSSIDIEQSGSGVLNAIAVLVT